MYRYTPNESKFADLQWRYGRLIDAVDFHGVFELPVLVHVHVPWDDLQHPSLFEALHEAIPCLATDSKHSCVEMHASGIDEIIYANRVMKEQGFASVS